MAEHARSELLAGFPVVVQLPILWGDMDAFGHVNNTLPIRWFESSRVAYLEAARVAHRMTSRAVGPILASVTCHYRRQLIYPDTIAVAARVARLGRTSITMAHKIYSHALDAVAAEGESVVAMFDYTAQRPVRVPDELRAAMETLEGRPLG